MSGKVGYYQSFAQKEVGQNIYFFKIASIPLFLALSRIWPYILTNVTYYFLNKIA